MPPWHALVWVALVPWLLALDGTATWREALASGAAMALAFSAVVFWWFPLAMADYAGVPVGPVAAVAALATPLFQPQLPVLALARHAARRRSASPAAVAIVAAGAYVGTEWLVPKLFGDTLAVALQPSAWLRQAADVSGLGGLTLAVVLVSEAVRASVAALAGRRGTRAAATPLAGAALVVGVLALYGAARLAAIEAAPAEPPVTVGIVQTNVAHYDRLAAEIGTYAAVRAILDAHFAVSEEVLARSPDVLVWPETVYPTTFGAPKSPDGAAFDRAIGGFVVRAGIPLVLGSYDSEAGREYNAAFFVEPEPGDVVTYEVYRKATLFPLTERVPPWLDGPRLRAWLPWLGSWAPGAGDRVVTIRLRDGRRVRVAPLICYDAVEPRNAARGVRDGAEVLVTLSNDSWLTDGPGAWLHLLVSAFRSIETRRPQVRATTTGISAVVTPGGDVVASGAANERAAIVARVRPVRGAPPLAARWGDWASPLAAAIAVLLLVRGAR